MKISKMYIMNYLMKPLPGITKSRAERIVVLIITMKKFALVSRRKHSMRSFCKSGIRIIWEQKPRMDSLLQRYLMSICRIFSREILH